MEADWLLLYPRWLLLGRVCYVIPGGCYDVARQVSWLRKTGSRVLLDAVVSQVVAMMFYVMLHGCYCIPGSFNDVAR